MKWPRVSIDTDKGVQGAIAPLIMSASRSTDIPAFYAEWFGERLEAGYCRWVNPNNRQSQYVSFDKARAFVFWSKYPAPLIPYLPMLDQRGVAYYFQFTVNDYEEEGLEPNVPPLTKRLEVFEQLSALVGKERVIWRFDPLVLTDRITMDDLLEKIGRIGERLHRFTEKLVFSFADITKYRKVRNNLKRCGVNAKEFNAPAMHSLARQLTHMAQDWHLHIATCGEGIDLSTHGIEHNRCIDGELLLRISKNDADLLDLLQPKVASSTTCSELPVLDHTKIKDKGQRDCCGCAVSKDIGQYDTCLHLCVYCYANRSAVVVEKNMRSVTTGSDSILE